MPSVVKLLQSTPKFQKLLAKKRNVQGNQEKETRNEQGHQEKGQTCTPERQARNEQGHQEKEQTFTPERQARRRPRYGRPRRRKFHQTMNKYSECISEPPYAAEQSRLFYRTDSAIEPWHRAALNVQCTDCPSSPATEQTSHHVYRFWTALLQSRLRRTCSIHISHESAVKGLQKKCCDERNVFICDWLFHCESIFSTMPCKH